MNGFLNKKIKFFLILNIIPSFLLYSTIDFSYRDSTIKINSGTTFNVGNYIPGWDGTLFKEHSSSITGNNIGFTDGVLQTNTNEGILHGLYDTQGNDKVHLQGNDRFSGQPGIVVQDLDVIGNNNRLEGQPLFVSQIEFLDSSTSLTIALQSKLNQNLNLNKGLLVLEDNLNIADTKYILGPGIVRPNNYQVALGAYYDAPWSTGIIWEYANDIALNGRTDLTNTWSFIGENRLNGNGNVLDLTNNGKIYVSPGSTLHLSDIHIRGLSDEYGKGKILLGDSDAEIRMYNTEIELVDDYTTTDGKMYVEGPTTFILKDNRWTFSYDSLLTVDGVTLWLDPLDQVRWPLTGQLKAPLPLFAGHYWQDDCLRYDLKHNLDLINSGSVKEVCDRTLADSSITKVLTSDVLTIDLDLDQSVFIHPHQTITIGANITINGNGAKIIFADPDHPQFVILPGFTVTLKNIELININKNTFDFRWFATKSSTKATWDILDSKMIIGEDVLFALIEDVTIYQGYIELIRKDNNDPNLFTVLGLGGQKRLLFEPTYDYSDALSRADNGLSWYERSNDTNNGSVAEDSDVQSKLPDRWSSGTSNSQQPILLKLSENTMGVQAINLSGIEHISNKFGEAFVGAIGLLGNVDIDIGYMNFTDFQNTENQQEIVNMVFVVQGLSNKFRLLKDNLLFTGQLLFADYGENALHIDSVLNERILPEKNREDIPLVSFGEDFIQLTSLNGMARLIFDDQLIRIYNEPNAFLAFENSFLKCNRLQVDGDSIFDLYDLDLKDKFGNPKKPFVVQAGEIVGLNDNVPIISEFYSSFKLKSLLTPNRISTALHFLQEKEKQETDSLDR